MRITILIVAVFALLSCNNLDSYKNKLSNVESYDMPQSVSETYEETEYDGESAKMSEKSASDSRVSGTIPIPDKIIKTANIGIGVKNYKESLGKIKQIVKSNNAYVSNEEERNYSYSISNTIVIRVTNKNFDSLIHLLLNEASKIEYKTISAVDVTEEFVDIEARLKTKKDVEKRYTEILKQARTIHEIMEVEEELRVIREEIEAKEGRLKYLSNQVDYSTINLSINQKFQTPIYQDGFFSKIANAFSAGWEGIKLFIIGIFYLWPLWIILGVGLYILLKFLNRKRKN